jgi:hypothetical protein
MILNSIIVLYVHEYKLNDFSPCILYRRLAKEDYLAPIFVTHKQKDRQTTPGEYFTCSQNSKLSIVLMNKYRVSM